MIEAVVKAGGRQFRPVHYLGSKLRLLGPIRSEIRRIASPGSVVCDLFTGSGTVALALSNDWRILAADIQEYSRVLASALLTASSTGPTAESIVLQAKTSSLRSVLENAFAELLSEEDRATSRAQADQADSLVALVESGSIENGQEVSDGPLRHAQLSARASLRTSHLGAHPDTAVSRLYGGLYFSFRQAIDLDALLAIAHRQPPASRDLYVAAALATASELVNTVGKQFAQPIRLRDGDGVTKTRLVPQTIRDRTRDAFALFKKWLEELAELRPAPGHIAVQGDFRAVLSDYVFRMDVIYADPPYTRDHYSRYYHVLETMARHDNPEISTTKIRSSGPRRSRGMYRTGRHQSPFSIISEAPRAFEELAELSSSRGVPLLLSYSPFYGSSRPRVIELGQLTMILRNHFREVRITEVEGSAHSKLNAAVRNVTVLHDAEVLVTCVP